MRIAKAGRTGMNPVPQARPQGLQETKKGASAEIPARIFARVVGDAHLVAVPTKNMRTVKELVVAVRERTHAWLVEACFIGVGTQCAIVSESCDIREVLRNEIELTFGRRHVCAFASYSVRPSDLVRISA